MIDVFRKHRHGSETETDRVAEAAQFLAFEGCAKTKTNIVADIYVEGIRPVPFLILL